MSIEKVVLGAGCFWCIESIYQRVIGVRSVVSGYAGGDEKATYENVCSGQTEHAEVVEVTYESSEISLEDLLLIFFTIHDPTSLNRQGNDIGKHYRSVIFFITLQQKELAKEIITTLEQKGVFLNNIVTQIEPLKVFYKAEDYHQNYFNKNPDNMYCQMSVSAKRKKIIDQFSMYLKSNS
jgi:peptide-methionine (S)-S-oxide reductase